MERPSDKIRLVILKGSVRPGNYTGMAAALVEDELKRHPQVSVETIDPVHRRHLAVRQSIERTAKRWNVESAFLSRE